MAMENELVQITFIGDHTVNVDRYKYLFRKFIPHKVYFIHYSEGPSEDIERTVAKKIEKELKAELPKWASQSSISLSLPLFDYRKSFPQLLKIMMDEKRKGNELILNLHDAPHVFIPFAVIAATLTGTKIYSVRAKEYKHLKGKIANKEYIFCVPIGTASMEEISFPLLPQLPESPGKDVLIYLLKNKGKIDSKLVLIAQKIGLEKLGNIKEKSSGAVKLSKILSALRGKGFVATKKIGRKTFEIALTADGKFIAEVLDILDY
jgi:hypothetical protein